MRKQLPALLAALLLALASACSFTTANISSLKVGKDKDVTAEANAFAPGDTIYAKAAVSNVPSKVTVKWRLYTEQVQGQPENGPVEQLDRSYDVESDSTVTYFLSPPPSGWPAGRYRLEVTMHVASGEQKDKKSATFTVSGQ